MLSCIVDLMKRAPRSKTICICYSVVHAVGRYLGLVHVAVTTSNLLGFLAVVVLIILLLLFARPLFSLCQVPLLQVLFVILVSFSFALFAFYPSALYAFSGEAPIAYAMDLFDGIA